MFCALFVLLKTGYQNEKISVFLGCGWLGFGKAVLAKVSVNGSTTSPDKISILKVEFNLFNCA
jgi:hypothetical protein